MKAAARSPKGTLPAAQVLIGAIRVYQLTLAPLFGGQCRFTPSCSSYAMQAVAVHGAARGSLLAARRVLRCSPLCAGGHDPVPPRLACTGDNSMATGATGANAEAA